jgi:hypothetical protein
MRKAKELCVDTREKFVCSGQHPNCRPVQIYLKTNWTDIAVTTQKENNVDFEREGAAQMIVSYYKKKGS